MLTSVDIDDELMAEAKAISGLKTKKEIVNEALKELIRHHQRLDAIKLRGKGKFWENYERELKEMRRFDLPEIREVADPRR